MLQKLFGMKTDRRQKLYEAFCSLPAAVKNPLIHAACWLGRRHVRTLATPPRLIWYVTSRCNARCSHCFFGRQLNQAGELSLEEFRTVVRSLRTRVRSVTLTGGEPFLRNDLPALCRALAEINGADLVTLPTNGFLPERIEAMLREILGTAELNVNVQVSLDGTREVHDAIRGLAGSYDRAVETVRRFKRMKSEKGGGPVSLRLNNVSVITTLCRQNESCLPELVRFVREELGVFHKFQFVRGAHTDVFGIRPEALSELDPFRPEKPNDIAGVTRFLSAEILRHDQSLLARRQVELLRQAAAIILDNTRTVDCLAGRIDGVIYANGDVALCELTRPFANLRDYGLDFAKLWNGAEAEAMRSETRQCFCTHPCNLSTSMSFDPATLKRLSKPLAAGGRE